MVTVTKKLSFIRRVFGAFKVDNAYENVAVVCPFCETSSGKKKLSIDLNTWQYHCWVCGSKSKNLTTLLRRFHDASLTDEFCQTFKVENIGKSESENTVEIKVSLPEGFIFLGDSMKSRDPDVRSCIRYLSSRGIGEKEIWRFGLGTARTGYFRRRIIIPSFDFDGDLNYFVGRAIDPEVRRKYVNASTKKSEIIFNEISINWKRELVIVEGPFDLMKSIDNSTCLLGSSISTESYLFKKIASNRTPVILALDSDMRKKINKIAKLLNSFDCSVRVVYLDDDRDIGSMTKIEAVKKINSAQQWDRNMFLKAKIGDISSGSIV